jgi:hypothetical protein
MNWFDVALGAGGGGFTVWLVPILVRKAKAAWDSFRTAK